VTGKFLDQHPHPVCRSHILDCYAALVRSRRPSSGNYDLLMDRGPKRYQCLRVPLSSDGRTIDMIIVGSFSDRSRRHRFERLDLRPVRFS